MTVLYDSVGELVTNDPTQGDRSALGILTDAPAAPGWVEGSSALVHRQFRSAGRICVRWMLRSVGGCGEESGGGGKQSSETQ